MKPPPLLSPDSVYVRESTMKSNFNVKIFFEKKVKMVININIKFMISRNVKKTIYSKCFI